MRWDVWWGPQWRHIYFPQSASQSAIFLLFNPTPHLCINDALCFHGARIILPKCWVKYFSVRASVFAFSKYIVFVREEKQLDQLFEEISLPFRLIRRRSSSFCISRVRHCLYQVLIINIFEVDRITERGEVALLISSHLIVQKVALFRVKAS